MQHSALDIGNKCTVAAFDTHPDKRNTSNTNRICKLKLYYPLQLLFIRMHQLFTDIKSKSFISRISG